MKALIIRIQLQEPVLATRPNAGEANSATSYSYIPGSMLRGAVIRAYHQKYPGVDISTDPDASKLFFGGQVCYLNAYLAASDGKRMLPAPLSWYVDKENVAKTDVDVFDFAVKVNPELYKPKRPKGEFCLLTANGVILKDSIRQVSVHNASDERGRKAAGISQVFRYEALAAGQVFSSVILSENGDLLTEIQGMLGDILFLGGSHTGGYGSVNVTSELGEADWNESEMGAGDKEVRITCLSDIILPEKGKSVLENLADALGLENVADLTDAHYQICLVGGFNRTWGLPLPQSWAIQAGSTFCLAQDAKIDTDKLRTMGIGERRTEGFGRVAVNWQNKNKVHRILDDDRTADPISLSSTSATIARGMAGRLLKAQLERKLVEYLASDHKFSELPSASQLNRVRVLAQQLLLVKDKDTNIIKKHFNDMKSAKKTWEHARIDNNGLKNWLITHSAMQADNLREIFYKKDEALPQVAGQSAELSSELLNEFSARLVDGVIKCAVEEKRIQEGR